MTRALLPLALLLCSCASPSAHPTPDLFGSFPRATVHGRIVNENGDGVGGLQIVAST